MTAVHKTPELQPVEREVLALISSLRNELARYVDPEPRRWLGTLRRMSFARAVQASNSIEGYDASLDDVIAAVDDEPTLSADQDTRLALAGYRDAVTYVLQVAQDPSARVDEGMLKSLHFMMLKHRLDKGRGDGVLERFSLCGNRPMSRFMKDPRLTTYRHSLPQ